MVMLLLYPAGRLLGLEVSVLSAHSKRERNDNPTLSPSFSLDSMAVGCAMLVDVSSTEHCRQAFAYSAPIAMERTQSR